MESAILIATLISFVAYHPCVAVLMVLDARALTRYCKQLNPNDAQKIKGPFGWRYAFRRAYYLEPRRHFRTKWYVWKGIGEWETWER